MEERNKLDRYRTLSQNHSPKGNKNSRNLSTGSSTKDKNSENKNSKFFPELNKKKQLEKTYLSENNQSIKENHSEDKQS